MINRLKEDQLNEYNIIDILFDKINEIIDTMNQHNHFEDYINNPEEYDKQEENECIDCNCYNSVICESCQEQNKFEPIQKPKQSWQKKLEEADKEFNEIQKITRSSKIIDDILIKIEKNYNLYKQAIEELIKDNEYRIKIINQINKKGVIDNLNKLLKYFKEIK